MTKQTIISSSSSSTFARPLTWTWQKRHWLIIIGLTCLMLWWIAPSLKTSAWFQSASSYLPLIGGLAFAADNILKLAH